MKEYQCISLIKLFFMYLIAFIPTWIMIFRKKTFSNKNTFLKSNCIVVFIEIIIFSLIYFFTNEIVSVFSSKTNIQNYMMYALKILFIASSTTTIQYSIPIIFMKKNIKTGIQLLLSKLFYIPVIISFYLFFNIKGLLYAVPICDILYTLFLICYYKKYLVRIFN